MSTATYSYTFDSDAQGWTGTPIGAAAGVAWDGSVGNPAGSLQVTSGATPFSNNATWSLSTTWAALGLPSTATVTGLALSVDERAVSGASSSQPAAFGTHYLKNNSGTILATLLVQRTATANESSWTTRSGANQAVPSGYQSAAPSSMGYDAPVLVIELGINQGGNNTAAQSNFDNVSLVVTYDSGIAGESGSGSLTIDHPTLAGTGSFALPTRTGSAALSRHPTLAGAGTRTPPVYMGSGSAAHHPTMSGSGTFSQPHGSGALSRHPTLAGSGMLSSPSFHGTGSLVIDHPQIGGQGVEGWVFHGAGTLVADHPVLAGTGEAGAIIGGGPSLFIRGSTYPEWLANLSLVVPDVDPGLGSGSATLFTRGGAGTGVASEMNLRVAADGKAATHRTNLVVRGSWGTEDGSSATLFLDAHPSPASGTLPLIVANDDPWPGTAGLLNLRVEGGNANAQTPCPLFLMNEQAALSSDVDLYVAGEGVWPGFFPNSSSIPLLIQRGPEGGITLFIADYGDVADLPLFVSGVPGLDVNSTLFVEGAGGDLSSGVDLVLPDVLGTGSTSSTATLVMPATIGDLGGSTTLFVSGWGT